MNSPENERQPCIYKYVSKHLTGSVERIPKKHILPFRIPLCVILHHTMHLNLPSTLCRNTILPPGGQRSSLPVHLRRWPFHFLWWRGVANQCFGFGWEHLLEVPSGNIYWKFKNWRTLCDWSFCMRRCIAVLGNLIPVRGRHYWEVEVDETTEFRIGVAYEDTERNSYLGANNTSWCMRHILTPSR